MLWRDEQRSKRTARGGDAPSARAHDNGDGDVHLQVESNAPSSIPRQHPQQCAVDNQRIINEQRMDYLGLTKPTKKKRIKASIVDAIDRRDYAEARRLQDQLEGMKEHERRVRGAKKARAKIIAKCRAQMNERARTPHPNSGDEGGHSNQ